MPGGVDAKDLSMLEIHSLRLRGTLAVLMAAVLVAACGTVDLGPRYSPPPIRMPEPLPATPARRRPRRSPWARSPCRCRRRRHRRRSRCRPWRRPAPRPTPTW
jgi:hypothetical protein